MKIFENEIWKDIEGYPDYQVNNIGRIKSFKYDKVNGKILKQCKNNTGYFKVDLWKNGEYKTKYIHRLMYEAFIGKIPEEFDVHHIDGHPENNYLDNFLLIPHSEHMRLHVINYIGNIKGIKLFEKDIIEIYSLLTEKKFIQKEIAKIYNVDQSTISNIKRGKRRSIITKTIKNKKGVSHECSASCS